MESVEDDDGIMGGSFDATLSRRHRERLPAGLPLNFPVVAMDPNEEFIDLTLEPRYLVKKWL